MGLSRRLLNLIVEEHLSAAKSLRCIDLTRQRFFNTTTPQQPNGNGSESEKELKMKRIWLPSPSFSFHTSPTRYWWALNCFPLADRKVLCTDQAGRTLLFNADTRNVATMPDLHKPKTMPLSLFVPSADLEDRDDGGGSVFVMEGLPRPEVRNSGQLSHQFEALVYRKPTLTSFSKSWQCHLLPPPPFVCEPSKYNRDKKPPRITSYAVIGGGSHICISAEGTGTYCLDTVSHTWSHEFEWSLPFVGKVEYVPELNLWFGITAKDRHLAAVDLSNLESQPQIVDAWKELNLPKEWNVTEVPQLVNLGSGRFIIVRFLQTQYQMPYIGAEIEEAYFVVLTGVEVVSRAHDAIGNANASGGGNDNGGDGKVEFEMKSHKSNGNGGNGKVQLGMNTHISRRHISYGPEGTICTVF